MPELRTVNEIVRDCCSESTAHGIPYVFKRENIAVKVFWLVCTMASAGVCGWLVGNSIMDYLSYETITQSKIVFETPTYFPTVTLCSQNMITTEAGYEFVGDYNGDYEYTERMLSYYFFSDMDLVRYGMGVYLLGNNFTNRQLKSLGLDIDDMILVCYYNNFRCRSQDFSWYFDPYYGGKDASGQTVADRVNTKAGWLFGLQMELYVGNPLDANSMAFVNGLNVLVHNKSEKPTYALGIKANVGQHTVIQVSRTYSKRLEKPYSECVEDIESYAENSIYVRTILESNYTYKQTDCYNVCLQRYVTTDCGCYAIDVPYWNKTSVRPCSLNNETACFTRTVTYFFRGQMSNMCGDNCPLECESVTYTSIASSVVYPSTVFGKYLANNPMIQGKFNDRTDVTLEELRDNILSINVFYNTLSYQSITEVEKTRMVDLVAGIGGTLGLFLGISFLSFIEIFDLLFCLLIAFSYRLNTTKKIDPKMTQTLETNINI